MKKLYLIFFLGFFSSCNETFEKIDRTDFTDVGKATLSAIIKNDTNKIKEFFVEKMSRMNPETKNNIFSSIEQFKNKKYVYLKTTTSSRDFIFKTLHINTYFKIDSSYYELDITYLKDNDSIIYLDYFSLWNLTERCSQWNSKTYLPESEIVFQHLNWFSYNLRSTFRSAKVEIENKTEYDIDFIKFRLTLKNVSEVFFKRTIIYNGKMYAGDISVVDITDLKDFTPGFTIFSENMEWEVELLEVLPKPESYDCMILRALKTIDK